MTVDSNFFAFYEGLPRQGPGSAASQGFALRLLDAGRDQAMCDAGCGTGADIEGLLDWAPEGSVLAVDTHEPFVEAVRRRFASDPRVTAEARDMATIEGPFDLIWCVGALYFMGLERGLSVFREALAPGGGLVFSYPAYFNDTPSDAAQAFWQGEDVAVPSIPAILERVRNAGFTVLDAAPLPDEAWEAYHGPMSQRIAALRPDAGVGMARVLDAAEAEIEGWRAAKGETGYVQVVASLQ